MKVLGINDEVTTCECCGKTNLKKTVVLEFEDGGEARYGVDCAAHALLGKKSSSNRKKILGDAVMKQYGRDLDLLSPEQAKENFSRNLRGL